MGAGAVSGVARAPRPDASRARWALLLAAVAGIVHGCFSLYWAAGGGWLVATLGERLVQTFSDRLWLLVPIGLVKVGFAVAPPVLARRGWPAARLWRPALWLGAAVLVAWGGLNTGVAHLVLAGAIRPTGGYDRAGMLGHAWLWDPLFLLWGGALVVGLRGSRRPAPRSVAAGRCRSG
jgi:hypothetical protein